MRNNASGGGAATAASSPTSAAPPHPAARRPGAGAGAGAGGGRVVGALLPFELSFATVRLLVLLSVSWLLFCVSSRTSHAAAPASPLAGGGAKSNVLPATAFAYHPYTLLAGGGVGSVGGAGAGSVPAVERVAANDANTQRRYPRNLRRIYDGTWQVTPNSPLPFGDVPLPPPRTPQLRGILLPADAVLSSRTLPADAAVASRALVNTTANVSTATTAAAAAAPAPTANTSGTEPPVISHNFAFSQHKGFALLTAENHQTSISALHIVAGELLFRDGPYRTSHDVPLRLVGVYEWQAGVIHTVSDSSVDDVNTVLGNLYDSLAKRRTRQQLNMMLDGNLTKERFIGVLNQPLVRMHKTMAIVRPMSLDSVSARCPFDAVFQVKQDVYMDEAPSPLDLGSQAGGPNVGGQMGIENGVGSSLRYAQVMHGDHQVSRGPQQQRGVGVGGDAGGFSAQDVMVKMTGTFVSERCKTKMTIELQTLNTELLFVKAINYTLLVTVVAFTQVIVLIRQMEMTSTQAGASRVSLTTVGLQAVADSYLCLGHLTLGIAVHTLFNAFATAAFFKFICFSIFLMRWMLLIWKARRPSGFSEGWEAMRRELSMLYSRFYLSLLAGLFLLYQLQDHIRIFIFALYSFWLPQIVLNVAEDHRKPLLPMYIIGTSLTRLAIPLYFWGCPNNFLHIHPLPKTVAALAGWIGVQALVLLSQYRLGPRWFIPKALLPEKYDYFREVLLDDEDDDDLEAQNKEAGEGDALVGNEPKRECCICMETVFVHSPDRMVTPCNHFFHAECLNKWLEVRLECALCRQPVPPP